ncbi:MAG: VCBS repeat-containing protein, partial [Hydrogenophaga sp.]
AQPIATFEEMVMGTAGARANNLNSACTVEDQTTVTTLDTAGTPQTVTVVQAMADNTGLSNIDGMTLAP